MKVFIVLADMSSGNYKERECIGSFSSFGNALKYLIDFNCEPIMGKLNNISIMPSSNCFSDKAYKVLFFHNKKYGKKVCFDYEIYEQELDKIPED